MIPLEDNSGDIIGKAQRGLGFSNDSLVRQSGITGAQLRSLKSGEFIEDALRRIAPVLHLGANQIVEIARGAWYPEQPPAMDGFRMFNTPFGGMTVNSYLAWDTETRKAVVFDSGADSSPVVAVARENKLTVELILLTHAHSDHVMDLPKLLAATKATAWVNVREVDEEDFPEGAGTFSAGQSFIIGKLRIETRLTSGHSAGQTTYVVRGLDRLIAIVGDSLFAGSMGGGLVSYADQLRTNKEEILTLADDTVLAAGHGPLTTVGQEKVHNPFFTG